MFSTPHWVDTMAKYTNLSTPPPKVCWKLQYYLSEKILSFNFSYFVASPMNKIDPFPGYKEYLRPHLDLEFIADHAKMQGQGSGKSKL
mmetsp:Transcript_11835/g.14734  ORF Transcript_11835/g.14734 Transcript_11835/m.14734 type:complete len:88 (-) Transcript_11835:628-891(-)